METALKLLIQHRESAKSILDTHESKLGYAKFSNKPDDIRYHESEMESWSKRVRDYDKAIAEVGNQMKLQSA